MSRQRNALLSVSTPRLAPRRTPRFAAIAAFPLALLACGDGGGGDPPDEDTAGDTATGDADTGEDAEGSDAATDAPDSSDLEADADFVDLSDVADGADVAPDVEEDIPPVVPPEREYAATIRWTSYGIPHILADDLGGAAFGQGYAYASQNLCILADQIVKVRSERALFHGRGADDVNVNTDFGYLALGTYRNAQREFHNLSSDVQELLFGYVAGYNHFLANAAEDEIPGPCRGEEWVRPIDAVDLFAYYLDLGELGSGRPLLDYLATPQPPGSRESILRPIRPSHPHTIDELARRAHPNFGSNGWGIGAERSAGGRGMLIANPHFPWEGDIRFWESHLTVPGVLNITGASLQGVVGVNIGFNEHLAWTHTVSGAPRFTVYKIRLVAGDPLTYRYGDGTRRMTSRSGTIRIREGDGTITEETRTLYRTHYGPVLDIAPFGWSNTLTFSVRDANADNFVLVEQFLRMAMSSNLDEFRAVHDEVSGIPWVYTMYADEDGNAFFTDSSAVPNLTEEGQAAYLAAMASDSVTQLFDSFGIKLLDGGDPVFEWEEEEGARSPGLVPFRDAPQLERRDFVYNANDSHWLTNPEAPLEGYPLFYGTERAVRTPRTRMNLTLLTETGPDSPSGADGLFTLEELQRLVFADRGMTAEILRADLAARCAGVESVAVDGVDVPIGDACDALTAWDSRYLLDSVGAAVFREWLGSFDISSVRAGNVLFAVPFDAADPIGTPRGLAPAPETGVDPMLRALGAGVQRLTSAGFAVDAPLGELQFVRKNGERVPIHGGSDIEGVFNIVNNGTRNATLLPREEVAPWINSRTGLNEDGFQMTYGTSFVMTMEFTGDGPVGTALLTYSQSSAPGTEHYNDQTLLYSNSEWRPILFTEEAIAADENLQIEELSTETE